MTINVVNFFSMLKKDDPNEQLVYYQTGIGTYTIPQIAQPWLTKLHKVLDMMLGVNLDAHVMSGYEFLMENSFPVEHMIHKVGLLPRHNHQQVPFAYKMYSREDETGWRLSSAFKQAFSIDVDIEFLGLWDTVASIGFINKRLPFTSSNNNIRYFRHALALDEHRARFIPSLWDHTLPHRQCEEHLSSKFGVAEGSMPKSNPKLKERELERQEMSQNGQPLQERKSSADKALRELEREFDTTIGANMLDEHNLTDVEEVWFSGCHCDVGGGAVKNETRNSLARIPLRWMIRQCFKTGTGILFHRELLRKVGLHPDTLWPRVIDRPPLPTPSTESDPGSTIVSSPTDMTFQNNTNNDRHDNHCHLPSGLRHSHFVTDFRHEEDEDVNDALTGLNDMLRITWGWWLLELLPQKIRYLKLDNSNDNNSLGAEISGKWAHKMAWANLGAPRHILHKQLGHVKVHRTVRIRMEAEAEALADGKKYVPRPEWDFEPVWVD
ncbi:hypothetical protein D9757_006835 [Collybiopsis confluens]|uniref:T6SS Phospholipase effector Tle1-like catalytic domain-containing protein n=1 Tax=Collybiopsis confluens TaxID=2823264 RepID=A0A8H5HPS0_9AGAR|nr:hypothetical protein D9757_006835 [Collybiopsis confluens]